MLLPVLPAADAGSAPENTENNRLADSKTAKILKYFFDFTIFILSVFAAQFDRNYKQTSCFFLQYNRLLLFSIAYSMIIADCFKKCNSQNHVKK